MKSASKRSSSPLRAVFIAALAIFSFLTAVSCSVRIDLGKKELKWDIPGADAARSDALGKDYFLIGIQEGDSLEIDCGDTGCHISSGDLTGFPGWHSGNILADIVREDQKPYDGKLKVEWKRIGRTVSIWLESPSGVGFGDTGSAILNIHLPKELATGSVQVRAKNGIEISHLRTASLFCESSGGDILAFIGDSNDIKLAAAAGKVAIILPKGLGYAYSARAGVGPVFLPEGIKEKPGEYRGVIGGGEGTLVVEASGEVQIWQ